MGLKFNPPPGWPLPYDFDPPPDWEPDPEWPLAPANWPLWIGSDAPPVQRQEESGGYVPGYLREPLGTIPTGVSTAWLAAGPSPGRKRPSKRRQLVQGAVVLVVLLVVAGVIGYATLAYRSSTTGQITKKGDLGVFSLRVGDCFQLPPQDPSIQTTQGFSNVRAIPCSSAHNAQVFAQFQAIGSGSYPGRPQLEQEAGDGCKSRETSHLARSKITRALARTLVIQSTFPLEAAWADGKRTISCVLSAPRHLTKSLVKKARSR